MPHELTQLPNWVLWAAIWNGSKYTKRPIQPSGYGASSTNPKHWSSFDQVRQTYERAAAQGYIELRERNKSRQCVAIGDVGFVFDGEPDENGLVFAGIDFDKVISDGNIASSAAERIRRLGSYTEPSVSGIGLHVIVKARPLQSGIAHDGTEIYTSGRFFTMTGRAPENSHIVAAADAFAALAEELRKQTKGDFAQTGGQAAEDGGHAWFSKLPADKQNEVVKYAALRIANNSKLFELTADGGSYQEYFKIGLAIARSGATDAENIFVEAASIAKTADPEERLREFFRDCQRAEPRTDGITVGSLFHAAYQCGANFDQWKSQASFTAAPSPVSWSPDELKVSFSNIPHRKWLYSTYLIRGEITVLAAPGGAGKTALATGIAVEIATGTELLGEKIFKAHDLKVLVINGEDSDIEIRRRIWAFCSAYANKIPVQSPAQLSVAGANDQQVQRLSFLTTDRNFSTVDQNGFQVLESALTALGPDLLILDPLVAFCGGGNMNDNAVMAQVIRELKRLATKFDCSILVVHHTRKGAGGDDNNAEAISGASAIVNLARRAIMPVLMTEREATQFRILPSERFRYFKLVDAKSNFAPRSANSPWYRLHSVELPNAEPPVYPHGDSVQALERVTPSLLQSAPVTTEDQKIRDAILNLVQRGKIIDERSYPYSPSAGGADNERALLEDAMAAVSSSTAPRQWSPADLEAVTKGTVQKLKKEGLLVAKDLKDLTSEPGRFRKGRGLTVNRPSDNTAKAKEVNVVTPVQR
jgi:hypothetical protein